MNWRQRMVDATAHLKAAGIEDPARDVRLLVAWAEGVDPGRVNMAVDDTPTPAVAATFDLGVRQRMARQPMTHILGRRSFYGREFDVTPDVLDPRPETETLIETALQGPVPNRILDLGVGSGCILSTLLAEWTNAVGVGVDVSAEALAVAERNALTLGVFDRLTLIRSQWWEKVEGAFDLIVSNPPYIATRDIAQLQPEVRDWEPMMALDGGDDGLNAYRAIASNASKHLTQDGQLLLEIGAGQDMDVSSILEDAGFGNLRHYDDLSGITRCIAATHSD